MDRVELFHNLVNLAAVDGKFTEQEILLLAAKAELWNIPADEFETAMAGLSTGEIQLKLPVGYDDRIELLKEMIRMMAIDGELAETEKALCAVASARMDFTGRQFDEILDSIIREAN